jgi:hypothetical protein
MARFYLLLIVALALAPGTWWRTPHDPNQADGRQILFIERLRVPQPHLGEIEVAGVWSLRSPNGHFGGYSALTSMGDGTLLALSDSGRMMRLAPPGSPRPAATFDFFAALEEGEKRFSDLEAVTRDPASGDVWAAYENTNQIARYDAALAQRASIRPLAMQHWPANEGAEAIVRLPHGRFIVLAEGNSRWFAEDLPALLFPADPVGGAKPVSFRFGTPEEFAPVDMTLLPDGRVLILLRAVRWGLPPTFESKLMVADPAEIRPGSLWGGREIAHLAAPLPTDNYEGLAIEPAEDGGLVLWLISDDNHAKFQRTLLLKALWRPKQEGA